MQALLEQGQHLTHGCRNWKPVHHVETGPAVVPLVWRDCGVIGQLTSTFVGMLSFQATLIWWIDGSSEGLESIQQGHLVLNRQGIHQTVGTTGIK